MRLTHLAVAEGGRYINMYRFHNQPPAKPARRNPTAM